MDTPRLTVFPSTQMRKPIERGAESAHLKHIHPHMLRHTFATRLRDKGVPLDRIMELLGHSNIQQTMRYAKMRPEQLFDAIAALES